MKYRRRFVMLLMCFVLVFSSLPFFHSGNVSGQGAAENLFVNGNFSSGIAGWDTYYYNGSCASGKITDANEFDMTIHYWDQWSWDGSTYYKIDWQAMLIQTVVLEAGKTYTVQFDAYASENRSIRVKVKDNDAWGDYFDLTTEKRTCKFSFDCTKSYSAEFQFLLGYVVHGAYPVPAGENDVYLSNIFLVEGDGSDIATGAGTDDSTEIEIPDVDKTKEYYIIKSRSSGKVLEAFGKNVNAPIIQSTYTEKYSQIFTLEETGERCYHLKSLNSGYVIGVAGDAFDNSAKLIQRPMEDSDFVQWFQTEASQGYVTLVNKGSGKVMDVPGASTSEGTQIAQYESNGTNAQQWDIIRVDIQKIVEGAMIPDTSTAAAWKENAVIAPKENQLVAAGPIALRWYHNNTLGNIVSYEITFDEEPAITVPTTDDAIMEYEWYNTKVSKHEVEIAAVFSDHTKIVADKRTFFVSKKGIGWGSLYRTEDMNLSWYYQWSMEEAVGTDTDISFVPMVWGNWGNDWLKDSRNQKYKTVLGFNEPDLAEQSGVSVEQALDAWKDFSNSGLRVGSPCTAVGAYWSKDWFWKFMDGVEADSTLKVDFITIHCYLDHCSTEAFLSLIDETWNKWHRPIWITEFGIASWNEAIWNQNTEGTNEKVYQFMKEILPELDKRPYVERYAWFPFDPKDSWGGSSGLFDYDTGELNQLGKLYAESGMPDGYNYVKYTEDTLEIEVSDGVEINGFQVSTTAKGIRTIYSVKEYIGNKRVEQTGLVYALDGYAEHEEMYYGSDATYVRYYNEQEGALGRNVGILDEAASYVMTVKFGAFTPAEYSSMWKVRAFAKLEDGSYVYSNVKQYSAYQIAAYLYDNVKMPSYAGHRYLYDEILTIVNDDYEEKAFLDNAPINRYLY